MGWTRNPNITTRAWQRLRRTILQRDGGQCTVTEQGARCASPATEVHHRLEYADGGTDHPDNLVSICTWHHRRITSAHANATRWARQRTTRPAEPHPGYK